MKFTKKIMINLEQRINYENFGLFNKIKQKLLFIGYTLWLAAIVGCGGGGNGGSILPHEIAFVSGRDGNNEIYAMNPDGSEQTRLTNNLRADNHPSYSPDGSEIAFESLINNDFDIYVMKSNGTGEVNLTNDPSYDERTPTFSPDGSKIAFVSNMDGDSEVYIMNRDGTGIIRVTDSAGFNTSPTWSFDGTEIFYVSNRDVNWQIYKVKKDGTGDTRITNDSFNNYAPACSPDGSEIVYHSNLSGEVNMGIYVSNIDGTGRTLIYGDTSIPSKFDCVFPAYSPTGNEIVFFSNKDGTTEIPPFFGDHIYKMNSDGTGVTRLTKGSTNEGNAYPVWGNLTP